MCATLSEEIRCESQSICRTICVRLNPGFYLQCLVQCMCMNFVNKVCVCVPSSPAQSARLCVETDFIIDTEATLICCKRFGNWSPLAGVIVKPGLQNSVSLPVLVQLSCVGIALEMATPVGSTPSFWRGLVLTFPQGCTACGRPGAPLPAELRSPQGPSSSHLSTAL